MEFIPGDVLHVIERATGLWREFTVGDPESPVVAVLDVQDGPSAEVAIVELISNESVQKFRVTVERVEG